MSRLITAAADGAVESIGLPCRVPVVLTVHDGEALVRRCPPDERPQDPVLVPVDEAHVLLAPPGAVWVMGLPLLAGACRLVDGDSIQYRDAVVRYSTRDFLDPQRGEPLAAPGDHPVRCAACLDPELPLQAEPEVTYCPHCQWAYHISCMHGDTYRHCPVCGTTVCRTDEQREAFVLRQEEVSDHERPQPH